MARELVHFSISYPCCTRCYTLCMDKAGLRKRLKDQRQKISSEDATKLNRLIMTNCLAVINFDSIGSIHTYMPITKNNEIDPMPLVKFARQKNPDVKIASWDTPTLTAKARWIDSELQLQKLVPESYQFGLIIVPLLGFDTKGHRLGYGGGFYDEFLAGQEHALTVGLCYE